MLLVQPPPSFRRWLEASPLQISEDAPLGSHISLMGSHLSLMGSFDYFKHLAPLDAVGEVWTLTLFDSWGN